MKGDKTMKVKVITMNGLPGKPTTPKNAKKLLNDGKAIVYANNPFTIKLAVPVAN